MDWTKDVCGRCQTTHPANESGERPCPKPPIETRERLRYDVGIVWKCGGGTRGFGGPGTGLPAVQGANPGHRELTTADLGILPHEAATIGL